MNIDKVIVGILSTNCYILEKEGEILIIDPGDNASEIEKHINGKLIGIIITHYHFDHVGALNELVNKYNIKVYDINNLKEGSNKIGTFEFEMIKTPGHKSDLISLLFDNKHLFCGDFIFEGSIGRTDFPTGNMEEMQESIRKIINMDPNIIIYPGHGNITTLKKEIPNLNMYI